MSGGGSFANLTVGSSGSAGEESKYITREEATSGRNDRVFTFNVPEYADRSHDAESKEIAYEDRVADLAAYFEQLEERELERERSDRVWRGDDSGERRNHSGETRTKSENVLQRDERNKDIGKQDPEQGDARGAARKRRFNNRGEARTHLKIKLSFDRAISEERALAMAQRRLAEEFPKCPVLGALHVNTNHQHVHALVMLRQTDDKKLHLGHRTFHRFDERWAEDCGKEFGAEITREHLAKKEAHREYLRAYRAAREQGEKSPERPRDKSKQLTQARIQSEREMTLEAIRHDNEVGTRNAQRESREGTQSVASRERTSEILAGRSGEPHATGERTGDTPIALSDNLRETDSITAHVERRDTSTGNTNSRRGAGAVGDNREVTTRRYAAAQTVLDESGSRTTGTNPSNHPRSAGSPESIGDPVDRTSDAPDRRDGVLVKQRGDERGGVAQANLPGDRSLAGNVFVAWENRAGGELFQLDAQAYDPLGDFVNNRLVGSCLDDEMEDRSNTRLLRGTDRRLAGEAEPVADIPLRLDTAATNDAGARTRGEARTNRGGREEVSEPPVTSTKDRDDSEHNATWELAARAISIVTRREELERERKRIEQERTAELQRRAEAERAQAQAAEQARLTLERERAALRAPLVAETLRAAQHSVDMVLCRSLIERGVEGLASKETYAHAIKAFNKNLEAGGVRLAETGLNAVARNEQIAEQMQEAERDPKGLVKRTDAEDKRVLDKSLPDQEQVPNSAPSWGAILEWQQGNASERTTDARGYDHDAPQHTHAHDHNSHDFGR